MERPTHCLRDHGIKAIKEATLYHYKVQESLQKIAQELWNEDKVFFELFPIKSYEPSKEANVVLQSQCTLLICGLVKAGKSTLINELFRDRIGLPVDETPCTLRFTTVTYGEKAVLKIFDENNCLTSEPFEFDLDDFDVDLGDYIVGERRDNQEKKMQQQAVIEAPLELLETGLKLVDSPGLNETEAMDKEFYKIVNKLQPTVVVIAYNLKDNGLGPNVIQNCDSFLKIPHPLSLILLANKMDITEEEKRHNVTKDPMEYRWNKAEDERILYKSFPDKQVILHGSSGYVLYLHRNYHEDGKVGQEVKAWPVLLFHYEFEMEIARQIIVVSQKKMTPPAEKIRERLHRVKALASDQLSQKTELREKNKNEHKTVITINFPMRLKQLHNSLLAMLESNLNNGWHPRTYETEMRQLFNINSKKPRDIVIHSESDLTPNLQHNLLVYLVDRYVNVLINTLRRVKDIYQENMIDYNEQARDNKLPADLHSGCSIQLILDDKENIMCDLCTQHLTKRIDLHRGRTNFTFENFLKIIFDESQELKLLVINYLKQAFIEEEGKVGNIIKEWSELRSADASTINQSILSLTQLSDRLNVLDMTMGILRSHCLGRSLKATHQTHLHLSNMVDKEKDNWFENVSDLLKYEQKENRVISFDELHSCQLLAVQYKGDNTTCITLEWNEPVSSSQSIVNCLCCLNLQKRQKICHCLFSAIRQDLNDEWMKNLCIHTLWIGPNDQLIYNPYLPSNVPLTIQSKEGQATCTLYCDCPIYNKDTAIKRKIATFLSIAKGTICCTQSVDQNLLSLLDSVSASQFLERLFIDY